MIKWWLKVAVGVMLINPLCGQTDLNNTRSEKHRQVKGTRVFLIPPEGFTEASGFQGFQLAENSASILVIELPGPFSEMTRGFNEEGLKPQGVILKKKEDIRVNGIPGLFMTTEQFAYGNYFTKYILVFGDAKSTVMVNATYPKEQVKLDSGMRVSMHSLVYESSLVVDPLSTADFKIETLKTKLKFAAMVSGMLMYTVDGKAPTESSDKTTFMVGQSINNPGNIDKRLATLSRLKKLPFAELKVHEDKTKEVEIDGMPGYEVEAEGVDKSSGSKELIYQVMLFSNNGYYIMVGTLHDNFESNLELLKQVARTFKRK